MLITYMSKTTNLDRELKKGSTELLILSLLDARARHGYDIGRQIELRSDGVVQLHVASLYRCSTVEKARLVAGRWWSGPANDAAATTVSPRRPQGAGGPEGHLARVSGRGEPRVRTPMRDWHVAVRERLAPLRLDPAPGGGRGRGAGPGAGRSMRPSHAGGPHGG